jgi:hypothetical protein
MSATTPKQRENYAGRFIEMVEHGIVCIATEKDSKVILFLAPDGWTQEKFDALVTPERMAKWKKLGFIGFKCVRTLDDYPRAGLRKIP